MKSSAKKVELASVDDLFSTEESRADAQREKVVEIPLSELHPFKGHPFKVKGRTESRAISDIIDYVANPQKTDNGRLITGFACDSRTVDAAFLLAKRQCIAATGRVQGRYEN